MNSIPLISQIKSAVEAASGNMAAAEHTQQEFSKRCIIVSQARSAVEAVCGNPQAALETQQVFASGIDGWPGLSQVKSAVQAGCGDPEGALRTQEAFSRQCIVVSQVCCTQLLRT